MPFFYTFTKRVWFLRRHFYIAYISFVYFFDFDDTSQSHVNETLLWWRQWNNTEKKKKEIFHEVREQGIIFQQIQISTWVLEMFSLGINAAHCHMSVVLCSLVTSNHRHGTSFFSLCWEIYYIHNKFAIREYTNNAIFCIHVVCLESETQGKNSHDSSVILPKKPKPSLLHRFFKIIFVNQIGDIFPLLTY